MIGKIDWDRVEQVAALVLVAALVVLLTFHGFAAALRQSAIVERYGTVFIRFAE